MVRLGQFHWYPMGRRVAAVDSALCDPCVTWSRVGTDRSGAQYPRDNLFKGRNIQELWVGDTSVGDTSTLHPHQNREVLEFQNNLWGLGTEQEPSCRTDPRAYMQPGGPVQQPYFYSVPSPIDCFKIPAQYLNVSKHFKHCCHSDSPHPIH